MKWDDSKYRLLTEKIIKAFYEVHDTLGPGFLEEAYHKALYIELSKHFSVENKKEYSIIYEDKEVSKYIPDLLVENKVIIEVKAVKELNENHKAQLISQLRVSKILIGFLVNFSKKELEFKRIDNYYQLNKSGLIKQTTL
ncbi:MAG: GxxExxY protein [Armatimonadetes bacterium CG07_land_8_20_14_0_80_40_9]|nr:MAG: GxxExxY protein [Armatimonadetes bacterium CG07_land_8_20_14_0_80_40_9]